MKASRNRTAERCRMCKKNLSHPYPLQGCDRPHGRMHKGFQLWWLPLDISKAKSATPQTASSKSESYNLQLNAHKLKPTPTLPPSMMKCPRFIGGSFHCLFHYPYIIPIFSLYYYITYIFPLDHIQMRIPDPDLRTPEINSFKQLRLACFKLLLRPGGRNRPQKDVWVQDDD